MKFSVSWISLIFIERGRGVFWHCNRENEPPKRRENQLMASHSNKKIVFKVWESWAKGQRLERHMGFRIGGESSSLASYASSCAGVHMKNAAWWLAAGECLAKGTAPLPTGRPRTISCILYWAPYTQPPRYSSCLEMSDWRPRIATQRDFRTLAQRSLLLGERASTIFLMWLSTLRETLTYLFYLTLKMHLLDQSLIILAMHFFCVCKTVLECLCT